MHHHYFLSTASKIPNSNSLHILKALHQFTIFTLSSTVESVWQRLNPIFAKLDKNETKLENVISQQFRSKIHHCHHWWCFGHWTWLGKAFDCIGSYSGCSW